MRAVMVGGAALALCAGAGTAYAVGGGSSSARDPFSTVCVKRDTGALYAPKGKGGPCKASWDLKTAKASRTSPPGAPGPKGDAGPQGVAGAVGAAGPRGDAGITGTIPSGAAPTVTLTGTSFSPAPAAQVIATYDYVKPADGRAHRVVVTGGFRYRCEPGVACDISSLSYSLGASNSSQRIRDLARPADVSQSGVVSDAIVMSASGPITLVIEVGASSSGAGKVVVRDIGLMGYDAGAVVG